ncbi:MAG: hypothetical protein A2Y25_00920 [Candidatus Melainabacteria bacterium GWF2_37_15]|nr:MAG: hypothetical protein A2Y25_00920 [Candidatus Melainabacteria bacterium GWF2_37_15]
MKVWFDGSFILNKKTGIGNYLLNLKDKFHSACINTEILRYNERGPFVFNVIPYLIWLNVIFYLKTLKEKPDIIVFPAYIFPVLRRKKTKYAAVIHDLAPYKNGLFSFYYKLVYLLIIEFAVRNADMIITVSQTIKKEIIEQFKIPEDRVKIIYNSVGNIFLNNNTPDNSEILERFLLKPNNFILTASTMNRQNSKRKNISACMEAFKSISEKYPDIKLVLVGKSENNGQLKGIKNKNIILTEYLSDKDLHYLFKNALMYVFPSLYEGFGIPILEAQVSGLPVIVSDIPVFREVAANSVIFCEPHSQGIAAAIEILINNQEKRTELIQKGFLNFERFNETILLRQIKEIFGNRNE